MKAKSFLILAIGLLLSHPVSVLLADKPSFQGIGNLQGTSDGRMAISADGLTAVGYRQLESDPYEAFYWTVSSGVIGLGYLPGGNLSTAAGISADGSVVVGYSTSSLDGQAFRWTEDEGMVGLKDLPGGRFYSTAYDVSADGSVVVGFSGSESAVDYEAFRCTVSNGIIGLGDLPGGEYESRAYAVSADGSVVVGYSESASGEQAFRWTESEGMSGLGYLWLGGFSQAYGISPDGSVVVGRSSVSNGAVAFRWTDSEGMVSLGDLPGGSVSGTAYDASTNGSIIVGSSNSFNDFEAFIWDEDNGIRSLQDLLINNYHLDLTGWHLRCAYGISDDGTIIVGSGNNPQGQREGWIAVLTELEPAIIYVDDDAAGANDGSSWADAYNDLQDALAIAWSGDEIRVAQGIYKPGPPELPGPSEPPPTPPLPPGPPPPPPVSPRSATFQLKNGVTLKGGYAGAGTQEPNARDIELYETILSGDLAGNDRDVSNPQDLLDDPCRAENSYHVVTGSGTDDTAVIDGFTITAGKDDQYCHNQWLGWIPDGKGGGMYNSHTNAAVVNCLFRENTAMLGGGVYNDSSNPTFTDCSFVRNLADTNYPHWDGSGGGMYNSENSFTKLRGCVFRENIARGGGGLCGRYIEVTACEFYANSRGGMSGTDVVVTDCIFKDNWGDAMSCGGSDVKGCTFTSNQGSGIFIGGDSHVSNCLFTANTGGGLQAQDCDIVITNCSFIGNVTSAFFAGIWNDEGDTTVINCISWGNIGKDGMTESAQIATWDPAVVNYCSIQGWSGALGGTGNTGADPCFVEMGYWNRLPDYNDYNWYRHIHWTDGDYHLIPDSPCIDVGDPNYIAGPDETDLDGRPRVIGGRIDMGAYETPIFAEARILPRTINLASKGKWITCYIWLSDDYDIADIDPGSVMLERQIKAEQLSVDVQKQVATAKFDREKVQGILNVGDIELTIICQLTDGTYFEATDIIQVADKSSGKSVN